MDACSRKRGYTLIEVLTVVAIMGILSSMGAVSLHGAVVKGRVKDAGVNVTAYMQRAANEATRLNEKLCVTVVSTNGKNNNTIKTYKGECSGTLGDEIDAMTLEASSQFGEPSEACGEETHYSDNMVTLTPRIGVSPIPNGCFLVKYSGHTVSIIKSPTKFAMYYTVN